MTKLDDSAEIQLQQELREMFLLDTQQQLKTYFDLVQQLNPQSWIVDIQHIYRTIHTIKGGAVTVKADAMFQAAIVLENLLSDLRYLEVSPPLDDGQLSQMLLEAGELLASYLEIVDTGSTAMEQVQLAIRRLNTLHAQVKDCYLSDWDEMRQVHQEFADQGFDLVALELEMSLNQLPTSGLVPEQTIAVGNSLLQQLQQIGQELNFDVGWTTLINSCQEQANHADCQEWRSNWPAYLSLFKKCAKKSGKMSAELLGELGVIPSNAFLHNEHINTDVPLEKAVAVQTNSFDLDNLDLGIGDQLSIDNFDLIDLDAETDFEDELAVFDQDAGTDLENTSLLTLDLQQPELSIDQQLPVKNLAILLDDFWDDADLSVDDQLTPPLRAATSSLAKPSAFKPADGLKTSLQRNVQIPVPLERLDRSAQQVVDVLLTTRGINSQSQQLRSQLAQLIAITAESAQFTTKLRQLQNDYTLLRNIHDEQEIPNNDLILERYRQGYSTINRLLENILRISELGGELATATQETFNSIAQLDRQILSLKDGIEVNRLVPFRNLTMRARAILRDLTNRYGKKVDLVISNEKIELDAGVVQQIEPALLHLLRNAYDHGIETVDERLAAGKTAAGQITLKLQRRGNIYRLTVQDDGRGIDAAMITTRAQSRGFEKTITNTNTELLDVICQPGFSSRMDVSEVSGRGVGMDVVANQITAIGGKLHLDTQIGIGSTFIIEAPAPQLLVSCVLLRSGERMIALPAEEILETVLLSVTDIQLDADQYHWHINTFRSVAPAYSLAAYWKQFSTTLPETAIGLRCRLDDQADVWLIADDLIEQSELLINPLPSPLVPPPGMLGVSLQPDGNLISVLDPTAITTVLKSRSVNSGFAPVKVVARVNTILVVDDAALIRRRLSGSLTNVGFAVQVCSDGLEALQWLASNEPPALMITDVEMPNMDGLTLIDRCRKTGIQIPILVLSSRLSEDWGKEAQRVGANEFLNKGFTTGELLSMVERLLAPQESLTV
jgi:chemotaxis protein histidine kinase CheA/ActR/RegA family two-component response regulator